MAKREMKPGNMLYPVPAALITVSDSEGHTDLMTAAWCGTVCSDPPMVSVSIRKSRFSHHMIEETKEFVVCLTTEKIVKAVDFCGVRSGRDTDKWKETGLHAGKARVVKAPLVEEAPVCIECRVKQVLELGSHDMFIAEVVSVSADETLFSEKGQLDLDKAGLICYSHGEYRALGKVLGTFGFSVRKKTNTARKQYHKKPAARGSKNA